MRRESFFIRLAGVSGEEDQGGGDADCETGGGIREEGGRGEQAEGGAAEGARRREAGQGEAA